MARAFRRKGDRFVGTLDEFERRMVFGLMAQTRQLLSPEREPTGDPFADLVGSLGVSADSADQQPAAGTRSEDEQPRDPALNRLLPSAHRGDEKVADEFRRLTEEGLRQRKSGNLDLAMAALNAEDDKADKVSLSSEEASRFLMALTDVRLLLAERMGMHTEEDAEALHAAAARADDEDPLGYAMSVYDFLTWMQESLTLAMMGRSSLF